MPVKVKKPAKPVYRPTKPWDSAGRSKQISLPGGAKVPARFFELAYNARGPSVTFGKGKSKREFSVKTLNGLIEKKGSPERLKSLLIDMKRRKKILFSKKRVLSTIDSITHTLNRKTLTRKEFSFLEDLRVCLIDYKQDLFGK